MSEASRYANSLPSQGPNTRPQEGLSSGEDNHGNTPDGDGSAVAEDGGVDIEDGRVAVDDGGHDGQDSHTPSSTTEAVLSSLTNRLSLSVCQAISLPPIVPPDRYEQTTLDTWLGIRNWFTRLPVELLLEIFEEIREPRDLTIVPTTRPPATRQPRTIAHLRLVCKQWAFLVSELVYLKPRFKCGNQTNLKDAFFDSFNLPLTPKPFFEVITGLSIILNVEHFIVDDKSETLPYATVLKDGEHRPRTSTNPGIWNLDPLIRAMGGMPALRKLRLRDEAQGEPSATFRDKNIQMTPYLPIETVAALLQELPENLEEFFVSLGIQAPQLIHGNGGSWTGGDSNSFVDVYIAAARKFKGVRPLFAIGAHTWLGPSSYRCWGYRVTISSPTYEAVD